MDKNRAEPKKTINPDNTAWDVQQSHVIDDEIKKEVKGAGSMFYSDVIQLQLTKEIRKLTEILSKVTGVE